MFDPHAWASHLTGDQVIRLAEALPSLMTAGAALSASVTSLVVAIKARQAAKEAQETANDATDRAREAAKEQIRFALKDIVRHVDSRRVDRADSGLPVATEGLPGADGGRTVAAPTTQTPPEEGGSHD